MARRSPCEFYLKYLLIHPDRYGPDQIREIVRNLGLDFIGQTYLVNLRAAVEPLPEPFYPHDTTHRKSQRYLVLHGVRAMFVPDKDMKRANTLLTQPRAKEIIETTLISGDTSAWISSILRRKGFDATKRSIDLYKHFFWNVDLLEEAEMRTILYMRTYPEASSDPDEARLMLARHESRFADARRKTAEMASSPMAALMTRLRYGLIPSNLELTKLVQQTRAAAVARAHDLTVQGGPKDGERARDFSLVARTMHELVSDLGDPEVDLKDDLASLTLATDSQPVPHIRQLSPGGEYTTDLAPEQEAVEAEFEEVDDVK